MECISVPAMQSHVDDRHAESLLYPFGINAKCQTRMSEQNDFRPIDGFQPLHLVDQGRIVAVLILRQDMIDIPCQQAERGNQLQ